MNRDEFARRWSSKFDEERLLKDLDAIIAEETKELREKMEAAHRELESVDGWEHWVAAGGGWREAFYGLLKEAKAARAAIAKARGEK